MAARRVWSDEQYAAIWRLHRRGVTAAQITRLCNEGEAEVPAFPIKRRTVADIIERLGRNESRGQALITRNRKSPKSSDGKSLFERITTPQPSTCCECEAPAPEHIERPCACTACEKPIPLTTWFRVTGPERLERYRAEGKVRVGPAPHPSPAT